MDQTKQEKKHTAAKLAVAAVLIAFTAFLLWYVGSGDPARGWLLPPCAFRVLTGLYCPGCGSARAVHDLMNGHIWAAFRMNPLAVGAAPFLAAFLAVVLFRLIRKRPLPRIPAWVAWAALGVILLYWVLRNLPWVPFLWLAPTAVG